MGVGSIAFNAVGAKQGLAERGRYFDVGRVVELRVGLPTEGCGSLGSVNFQSARRGG